MAMAQDGEIPGSPEPRATYRAQQREGPGRDASPPPIRRSSSMLVRMRTETYHEIGTLISEVYSGRAKTLLVFVPVGIIAAQLITLPAVVFWLNFLALVPLTALILYAVLLGTHTSVVMGGVVRATLGNTMELILGLVAVYHGEMRLAQRTLIGSVLIYSLLVLGCSFFYASFKKRHVLFSKSRTAIMSALVMSSSICLTLPTVISVAAKEDDERDLPSVPLTAAPEVNNDVLFLSRISAMVLLVVFVSYLSFRFRTHSHIFPQNPEAPQHNSILRADSNIDAPDYGPAGSLTLSLAFIIAVSCAVFCANYLMKSVDGAAEAMAVTKSFLGLVIIPLAGCLAKSITIIRHARTKAPAIPGRMSRLDFAIRSVMTNVLDTVLFILPVFVIVAWLFGQSVDLNFGLFESVVLLMSIIIMTYLVQQGKTTYFQGLMLIGTYICVVSAFYVRPEPPGLRRAL